MSVFAITILTGAFLLFLVQPLMGKYLLPWFGGGTAVWSTCMVFFQVVLLAGYAYAHFSARWLRPRMQALAHLALVCAALICLPVIPNPRWQPNGSADPTFSILLLLTVTVGLPYFVLSATGPLMQHWFSLAKPGASPYGLYALSNAGSLAALAAYPLLFEPLFTRKTQAFIWSSGLGFYAVSAAACAVLLWRARLAQSASGPDSGGEAARPGIGTKLLWLLLPACASALMLAITNKMCLDVVVMPFLWVLPLALYLLSFVVSFAGGYIRRLHGGALAFPLLLLCYVLYNPPQQMPLHIPIYAYALFYSCLVCHGELYKLKPSPRHLTTFYLMIATGGALGGVFVALIAPLIFNDYFELHWSLAMLPVLMAVIHWREGGQVAVRGRAFELWRVAAAASVIFALLLYGQARSASKGRIATVRNFYGVLKLSEWMTESPDQRALVLQCGTTLHGLQLQQPGRQDVPTAYYHERSGIGLLMSLLRGDKKSCHMGVIGLGAGTLAAYGRTGDAIRFYEINPTDIQIATERFSFLSHSKARTEVVLGDARLSLERELPQQYDVLVLDAFNSDAVPVHLLTKEAFQIYGRHLKPDGVIAAHISTRHLNLIPVLEHLASEFDMDYAVLEWSSNKRPWWMLECRWFLLSRNKELLSRPEIRREAKTLTAERKRVGIWTDDYSSLLPILNW